MIKGPAMSAISPANHDQEVREVPEGETGCQARQGGRQTLVDRDVIRSQEALSGTFAGAGENGCLRPRVLKSPAPRCLEHASPGELRQVASIALIQQRIHIA